MQIETIMALGTITSGGPGSGRKPSPYKGLNKWKSEEKERQAARKDPKQMKLPLKAGGPGSGRHKTIEVIEKHGGWYDQPKKFGGRYGTRRAVKSPSLSPGKWRDRYGNEIAVGGDGSWAHYNSNSFMTTKIAEGKDHKSLDKHLVKNIQGADEDNTESELGPISRKLGTKITKEGTQYCVYSDKEPLGCYPDMKQAKVVSKGGSFISPAINETLKAGGPGSGRHKYAVGDRVKRNPAIHPKWKTMPLPGTVIEQVIGMNNQNKPVIGYRVLTDEDKALMNKPGLDKWERPSGRGTFYTEKELVPHKDIKAGTYEDQNKYGKHADVTHHAYKMVKWTVAEDKTIIAPDEMEEQDYYRNKYKAEVKKANVIGGVVRAMAGMKTFHFKKPPKVGVPSTPNKHITTHKMPKGVGHKMTSPSMHKGIGVGHRFPNPSFMAADYGEPMAGNMSQGALDTRLWFTPPSLANRGKGNRVPTDDPMEKNDKFLDVTKRNSKDTKKQRMKLLKRGVPGGLPAQLPAHTSLTDPTMPTYLPGMFGKAISTRPARDIRDKRTFRAYGAAQI